MKYKFLVAAMLAAMPFMASSSTSVDGKAFTVNKAKVSSSENLVGCPTFDTPLRLTFTEDMKPIQTVANGVTIYYDGWLGKGAGINPWQDFFFNSRFAAKNHEIHIYVEFFDKLENRFSDKQGIFAYTDNNYVMLSSGEYQWQHMPTMGPNIYKAVIPWNKGETKSIYLPTRNFKTVEVFYFQDNIPLWDRRNLKPDPYQLRHYYDLSEFGTGTPKGGDVTQPPQQAGDPYRPAVSLFLYQKLTRNNPKDTTISFKQKRGSFNHLETASYWTREVILLGGPGSEALRNKDLNESRYQMEDNGVFSKALKIDSIDLKLMENKRIGPELSTGTYIASYDRTDFSMTPENMRICGLD